MLKISKFLVMLVIGALITPQIVFAAVLDWKTNEGIIRFENSKNKHDFFELAPQFEGQINKVYCGIASATIILNSFLVGGDKGFNIPIDDSGIAKNELIYFPKENNWTPFWERYTQNSVVNYSEKPRINIFGKPAKSGGESDYGLTLKDEKIIFEKAGLNAELIYVSSSKENNKVKKEIIKALATPDQFVVVNYLRSALGQNGGGHFSPLGAYDEKSDSFLIMDVSNTNYSWVWVDSADLLKAMNTDDGGNWRGYLVIKEK